MFIIDVIRARGDDAGDLRALYTRALRLGVAPQALVDLAEECGHEDVLDAQDVVGCTRTWQICEDGTSFAEARVASASEALDSVDPSCGDYAQDEGPVAGSYYALCAATGESDARDWTLDQIEPDCSDDRGHVWSSDHAIVGGCRSNPGVRGHGAGTTSAAACLRCGCGRLYDSWWQRPDTGEVVRGTVTTYEPRRYDLAEILDGRGVAVDGSAAKIRHVSSEDGDQWIVISPSGTPKGVHDNEEDAVAEACEEYAR